MNRLALFVLLFGPLMYSDSSFATTLFTNRLTWTKNGTCAEFTSRGEFIAESETWQCEDSVGYRLVSLKDLSGLPYCEETEPNGTPVKRLSDGRCGYDSGSTPMEWRWDTDGNCRERPIYSDQWRLATDWGLCKNALGYSYGYTDENPRKCIITTPEGAAILGAKPVSLRSCFDYLGY